MRWRSMAATMSEAQRLEMIVEAGGWHIQHGSRHEWCLMTATVLSSKLESLLGRELT